MILTQRQRDWLAREAIRVLPHESCGVLVGSRDDAAVRAIYRSVNLARAPERSFRIDPVLLAKLSRSLRGGGHALLGCYHSHPSGGAVPSSVDAVKAWPRARSLILSVRGGDVDELRCWVWDRSDGFREEEITIEA